MIDRQPSQTLGPELSDYDIVAAEYYDTQKHPTCANFSELSARFLVERILQRARFNSRILEVGARRSIVAPVLAEAGLGLATLTLLDKSAAMLAHSLKWKERGASMIIADARATTLRSASFDLVVASLCDPYNCIHFWQETRQVLASDGICFATLPAHEWAARFREKRRG
jgi:hypothetical protein